SDDQHQDQYRQDGEQLAHAVIFQLTVGVLRGGLDDGRHVFHGLVRPSLAHQLAGDRGNGRTAELAVVVTAHDGGGADELALDALDVDALVGEFTQEVDVLRGTGHL